MKLSCLFINEYDTKIMKKFGQKHPIGKGHKPLGGDRAHMGQHQRRKIYKVLMHDIECQRCVSVSEGSMGTLLGSDDVSNKQMNKMYLKVKQTCLKLKGIIVDYMFE